MFPIIEKLGGWEEVAPLLARGGIVHSDECLRKWRVRGISAKASLFLSLVASDRGIRPVAEDFKYQEPIAAE